ncbi:hypothetical protein HBH61_055960 [Parastagonospora nodorum]|nr:hypothetical protein HBH61_055960 [Parastagonospora nodorum]KAH4939099.1 hypothetical protein HBI79_046560 [Parastagonospora nodorum]KAH5099610.1 hypothetical protein HBH72_108720 [Parastagonospora nodorum]
MDLDYAHSSAAGVAGPFQGAGDKLGEQTRRPDGSPESSDSRLMMDDDLESEHVDAPEEKPSIASAVHWRKRTGSLRQAAMAKMRERIVVTPPMATGTAPSKDVMSLSFGEDASDGKGRRLHSKRALSSPAGNRNPEQSLRYDPGFLASPSNSNAEGPYVSTTDEDDVTAALHPTASSSNSSFDYPAAVPAMSLTRRSHRAESRTFHTDVPPLMDSDLEDDDWDYSETEWWGWVILAATWIVFVVVMGSCFGVWSWAWDVGETPYAPPDLEDDDTLPITGYYPALMVCTAVMSWVWVVVAWVGMKYFRHAKVVADDG